MIQLRGVSKEFTHRRGRVEALQGIDLEAGDGEFVAVVGRSGCGKSTLLRLIAGLAVPTRGEVLMGGRAVTGPRGDCAVLFQRPALLPWRSVLDNVLLPAEISGDRRDGSRKRALGLIEAMGLDGFQRRLPHELSGGMQQRVALCRSLMQRPRVLLMDEPFPRSTRSPGTSCAPSCSGRTASIRPPSSSSPTPSTRRSCWPTGWWC
ncbi:ABC transporter ATP-binding protein [Streptomyces sp. MBT53]|uniref:ABC transporter ATP-binding protein n=1 Tax=Streptomyces sp. MBT53 TaxID=1488384 RepID=UPI0035AC134F